MAGIRVFTGSLRAQLVYKSFYGESLRSEVRNKSSRTRLYRKLESAAIPWVVKKGPGWEDARCRTSTKELGRDAYSSHKRGLLE